MKQLFLVTLIVLAWPSISVHAEQAKPKSEQVVMKIYDVGEITRVRKDFKCPRYTQFYAFSDLSKLGVQNPYSLKGAVTLGSLAQMIQDRIKPESWNPNLGTSLEDRGGFLIVMQHPAVHRLIGKLLKNFQSASTSQILVRGRFVAASRVPSKTRFKMDGFEKELQRLGKGTASLVGKNSVFKMDGFKEKVKSKGGVVVLARPQLICQNLKRAHIRCGREFRYIADYDVSGIARDPVLRTLLEGYLFEAMPALLSDQKTIDLTLNLNFSRNVTFSTLRSPENKGEELMKRVSSIQPDAPTMDLNKFSTQVRLPPATWVLAATGSIREAKNGLTNLLFFVSAEVSKPE